MPQLASEIQQVLVDLGFHAHRTSFDLAVPNSDLRAALNGPHLDTAVSRILRHLPDLFVLHPNMARGIFFVRIATTLSADEQQTYADFFPKDVLMLSVAPQGSARRILCTWMGRKKQTSLLTALSDRFEFAPTAQAVKSLEKRGWIV